MNIDLLRDAWESSRPRAERVVLVAMASLATGNRVSASIPTLAGLTGYSDRQVQRAIRGLRSDGLLILIKSGGGKDLAPNTYDINLDDDPPYCLVPGETPPTLKPVTAPPRPAAAPGSEFVFRSPDDWYLLREG